VAGEDHLGVLQAVGQLVDQDLIRVLHALLHAQDLLLTLLDVLHEQAGRAGESEASGDVFISSRFLSEACWEFAALCLGGGY